MVLLLNLIAPAGHDPIHAMHLMQPGSFQRGIIGILPTMAICNKSLFIQYKYEMDRHPNHFYDQSQSDAGQSSIFFPHFAASRAEVSGRKKREAFEFESVFGVTNRTCHVYFINSIMHYLMTWMKLSVSDKTKFTRNVHFFSSKREP
jgi:hypothetical protein